MYNLGNVMRFEIERTVKKRSFWLFSLMFPMMIGLVIGIIYFSNKATSEASEQSSQSEFSYGVTDDSGLVKKELLEASDAKIIADKAAGINDIKSGELDAYFYYPKDVSTEKVEVYGEDVGLFDNSRYSAVAKSLITQSVSRDVRPDIAAVVSGSFGVDSVTYKDGEIYNGFNEMIAPGIFLVLFYVLIATFGNQMLNSTTEEKENRIIEMILTTIEARTLVVGKILSLVVLGLLQMIIVLIPVLIAYLFLHDRLELPAIDLSGLTFDWPRILTGFVIFSISFVMFTGLLVTIGAATPTAKEAGPFFGVVVMLIFGPLYAAPLFLSAPESPIVQTLSLFPFTAPIPLMLRNAVGNLSSLEAIIAIIIMLITTSLLLSLAVRTFKYGALEYSRKLSIKEILTRRA